MKKSLLLVSAFLPAAAPVFGATPIIDTTPPNNQANLSASGGQSFTTPVMGSDNLLTTITVITAASIGGSDPTGPFTLKVWTNGGSAFSTWNPTALVGTSTNSASLTPAGNQAVVFNFSNEALSDDTVYLFSFSSGDSDHVAFRAALTNANGIANGALFSAGSQPFSGAFDVSFQLAVIPESSAVLLGGLGLLATLRRRR